MGNARNIAFWVVLLLLVLALFNMFNNSNSFAAQTVSYSRSEEHTSELQSLLMISYAVFCL